MGNVPPPMLHDMVLHRSAQDLEKASSNSFCVRSWRDLMHVSCSVWIASETYTDIGRCVSFRRLVVGCCH